MKLRATIEVKGYTGKAGEPSWRIQTKYEIEKYPTHVKIKFPDAKNLELVLSYEELSDLMTEIQLVKENKS